MIKARMFRSHGRGTETERKYHETHPAPQCTYRLPLINAFILEHEWTEPYLIVPRKGKNSAAGFRTHSFCLQCGANRTVITADKGIEAIEYRSVDRLSVIFLAMDYKWLFKDASDNECLEWALRKAGLLSIWNDLRRGGMEVLDSWTLFSDFQNVNSCLEMSLKKIGLWDWWNYIPDGMIVVTRVATQNPPPVAT